MSKLYVGLSGLKYTNGSLTSKIVVVSDIILATYKLPPTHISFPTLIPPATYNAPEPIT